MSTNGRRKLGRFWRDVVRVKGLLEGKRDKGSMLDCRDRGRGGDSNGELVLVVMLNAGSLGLELVLCFFACWDVNGLVCEADRNLYLGVEMGVMVKVVGVVEVWATEGSVGSNLPRSLVVAAMLELEEVDVSDIGLVSGLDSFPRSLKEE